MNKIKCLFLTTLMLILTNTAFADVITPDDNYRGHGGLRHSPSIIILLPLFYILLGIDFVFLIINAFKFKKSDGEEKKKIKRRIIILAVILLLPVIINWIFNLLLRNDYIFS